MDSNKDPPTDEQADRDKQLPKQEREERRALRKRRMRVLEQEALALSREEDNEGSHYPYRRAGLPGR